MKLKLWILAAVLVIGATVLALRAWQDRPEWTTDSDAALAEFRRGLDAEMKFYHPEAYRHFSRALELDPEFVAAQVLLARLAEPARRRALLERLSQADLERLTPRERFMARYALALHHRIELKPQQILRDYLAQHPRDPYALEARSLQAWNRQDWEAAERSYKRLLEIDPNWARAQNHLGYLAMARGRFEEAEDLFRTYLYIAPDQANPNDSMGELLTIRGRYEEAERALLQAIRTKPDFCASYEHLVQLAELSGQHQKSAAILAQAERQRACPESKLTYLRCSAPMWRAMFQGDLVGAQRTAATACAGLGDQLPVQMHRFAVLARQLEQARSIEGRMRDQIERIGKGSKPGIAFYQADLLHMEGVRLLAQGETGAAALAFRQADDRVTYWGNSQGIFKLFNLMHLAAALRRSGDRAGSAAVVAQIGRVNPKLAERYRDGDFAIP